ncbi:transcriptional regulator [Pseudomonas sp. SAS7]|uniref:transcriptional regulator n=1 Tax=Pseudomonas sp. SAS7 TaxID=3156487 RepID=UPI003F9613FC
MSQFIDRGATVTIHQLRNDDEYRAALREVSPLFDNEPEPGTKEAEVFEAMVLLIEAYEAEHYPLEMNTELPTHRVSE